jgi:hypothetical protein
MDNPIVFKVEQLGYPYSSCANQQSHLMGGPNGVGQPPLVATPQSMQNGGVLEQSSLSPSNPHKRIKRHTISSISSDDVESVGGEEPQDGLANQALHNQVLPPNYYGKSPSNNSLSSQSSGWQAEHVQQNPMDHG